jgi:formylglycine-generating enzyme required for sulfatase activity
MTSAERKIRVYCPTHKTDFDVRTVGRIVCASDPHALAENFPYESFWEYCCDCRRFRPSELNHGGHGAAACAACRRAAARRYLCDNCKILSVESDEPGFRQKNHVVSEAGVVGPNCSGCGRATEGLKASPHECGAAAITFYTSRDSCPFCEEPLGGAAARPKSEDSINFPLAAEECLKYAAARESKIVKTDPLKGILVKDREGRGQLILVHDWGVPGGVLYLFPRLTRFQTLQDFYNHYEQFYNCDRPGAGAVWVKESAVVRKVSGGWKLSEKGELEIREGARVASHPAQSEQKKPAAPPAAAHATTPRQEPLAARPVSEAKAPPPARTTTSTASAPKSPPRTSQSPQTRTPQTQATRSESPQSRPTTERETLHATTPRQGQASTQTTATPAHTYYTAMRETGRDPLPQPGSRRALTIALGAFVAVAGIGLLIAAIASRRPSDSNPSANASTIPSSNSAASSTAGVAGSYSPENPPPGMVYVPGGGFIMGSTADAYERPAHEASVGPFFIDTYEVTCADYAKFVSAKGHRPPPSWGGAACPAGREHMPVTGVNWDDATAYAAWAGKRLPTEAEWEFAARGNDGRRYPWGDEWESAAANVKGMSGQLADVGTYRSPSPFGAYDMSGNVWEWTATDSAAYPGADASVVKSLPRGKVIRGGCYASIPSQATTTYRGVWRPREEKTYEQTGFRCVMDIPRGGESAKRAGG